MRGRNLIKLLKALELFARPQGTTIEELSEHLSIDRRSVYRLLHVIEELGFPIYDDKIPFEKRKQWKLVDSYLKKLPNMSVPDINLTLSEIVALYLMKGEAKLIRQTELEKHVNSAFGKLSHFLPEKARENLGKIKALFISTDKFTKDYSDKREIIDELIEAMIARKICLVTYHSFGDDKIKQFKIDPLHFFEHDGGLYLFVRTTTFGDIIKLAVERVQELIITKKTFEYPKDFDPEELLDSAFDIVYGEQVHYKIWFSADQARYIKERIWSKTQKITDQPDGSIIFEMTTSGWWHVKRWILSWGKEAKLIEPINLVSQIGKEALEIHKHY